MAEPSKTQTTDPPQTKEPETKEVAKTELKSDGKSMYIKVYGPFKTYFDGQGVSISAINDTGPFDILPRHHNFMTLLNECEVIVRTDKNEVKININRGIMHVKSDKVIVFLDV